MRDDYPQTDSSIAAAKAAQREAREYLKREFDIEIDEREGLMKAVVKIAGRLEKRPA